MLGDLHCEQPASRQRTAPMAGNPCDPATSPHPTLSCPGICHILGWFSNRTGTSVDNGKARRKDLTWLQVFNLPFCHWSSQFDLRALSSTDVLVLLLNQPIMFTVENKGMQMEGQKKKRKNILHRKKPPQYNTLKCALQPWLCWSLNSMSILVTGLKKVWLLPVDITTHISLLWLRTSLIIFHCMLKH